MASRSNSYQDHPGSRKFWFDDLPSTVVHTRPSALDSTERGIGSSGRRFILLAGMTLLVLWGALYLAFRDWRARYRARTSFGVTEVAPVIDSLGEITPPGVSPDVWQDAVRRTHVMLAAVLSANLLDARQMEMLRDELKQAVKRTRSHPETAREELGAIWTAMADRAEFVLQSGPSGRYKGHSRPAVLPARPVKEKPGGSLPSPTAS